MTDLHDTPPSQKPGTVAEMVQPPPPYTPSLPTGPISTPPHWGPTDPLLSPLGGATIASLAGMKSI